MDDKAKKIIKYVASSVIAILFIWLVFKKVDWQSFWDGLQCTRWGYIALFILVSILALVLRAFRWHTLLRPLDNSASRLDTWDAINVSNIANIALPGIGELIRCGYMSSNKSPYTKTFGTIVMERIWDVLAIIVLIALSLVLKWKDFSEFFKEKIIGSFAQRLDFSLWWAVLVVIVLIVALVWLLFHFKGKSRVCAKIYEGAKGVLVGFKSFSLVQNKFLFAMYTVGIWLLYLFMSYFGLKAIPALSDLSFVDAIFISAIGNIASVIPVPSGMGPYHYLVMAALSGLFGCTSEVGLLYAVLCHETHAVVIIVVGIISYCRLSLKKKTIIKK